MHAYTRYAPALQRKAERILQNRADAQDVVQTLFVELLQEPDARADFAYLYRAVTNRWARREVKRERVHRRARVVVEARALRAG